MRLEHGIVIQHDTSNGTGEPNWTTLHTMSAAKKGLSGRLFYAASASKSENDVIFTIRYCKEWLAGIHPKMLIVCDGQPPYEITAEPVDLGDIHQWIEIHAKRVI